MAMLSKTHRPALLAVVALAGALAAGALASCSQSSGRPNTPLSSDCKVDVLPNPPGSDYVEVGELMLDAHAANPNLPQYKNPYALEAAIHDQICAAGADTLVTERNAYGIIVRGAVYRRATIEDVNPPSAKPPKAETCKPECGPGFTCEGGTCVQHSCAPACGDDATCGPDLICHPNS
jgi:hypothetical protein